MIPALGGHFRLDTARNRRDHTQRLVLFERLLSMGALDTIRAVKDGTLTWPDVHAADRKGNLGMLAYEIKLRRPLWVAVESVFPAASPRSTVQRYRRSFERLRKTGVLPVGARVIDLIDVDWNQLATTWGGSGTDWNHLRRAVSRLFTLLAHADHPSWLALRASFPIKPEHVRMPAHSLDDLARVVHAAGGDLAAWIRLFLITGLRGQSEMFKAKAVTFENYRVQVTKSKTRWGPREITIDPRAWCFVVSAARQRTGYWSFVYQLERVCRAVHVPTITPHTLRHLAGQAMDRAGIPYGVQQSFLGHRPPSETDKYRRAPFTPEHARLLYDALGPVFPPDDGKVLRLRRNA